VRIEASGRYRPANPLRSATPKLIKLLIFFVTISTVGSQLLLKQAMKSIQAPAATGDLGRFFLESAVSPWVYGSLLLQMAGYLVWLIVVSKEQLGVAFATSGAFFYLLVGLSAWLIHGERLSLSQWTGIGLITLGVLLVSR
jgi:multidrug transporter EmrE-like cation transporter